MMQRGSSVTAVVCNAKGWRKKKKRLGKKLVTEGEMDIWGVMDSDKPSGSGSAARHGCNDQTETHHMK